MIPSHLRIMAAVVRKAQEDYAGLWEIPAVQRTMGVDNPERAARSVVRDALDHDLLDCVWGNPNPTPAERVAAAERDRIIADESFWREDVPFEGRTVWLCVTAKGERWLADRG